MEIYLKGDGAMDLCRHTCTTEFGFSTEICAYYVHTYAFWCGGRNKIHIIIHVCTIPSLSQSVSPPRPTEPTHRKAALTVMYPQKETI
jgi:hypothetical protein